MVWLGITFASFLMGSGSASAEAPDASICQEIAIPVEPKPVASADIYRAANVDAGRVDNVRFSKSYSPIAGRRVLQIDPLISAAILDDATGIQLTRDVNGDGHITGAKIVRSVKCWLAQGDFSFEKRNPNREDEVVLNDYPSSSPRETIRLENRGKFGRLHRVLQFPDMPAASQVVEPLIVTDRPIEAFGVSVPSIEGGWRSH